MTQAPDATLEARINRWTANGHFVAPLGIGSKKPTTELMPYIGAYYPGVLPDGVTLGLHTGLWFFVLDIDVRPDWNGFDQIKKTEGAHGFSPERFPTYTVSTPSGGRHYYYKTPPAHRIDRCYRMLPGVDLLADGAVVVAPGERTEAGAYVELTPGTEMVVAPPQLLKLIAEFWPNGFIDYAARDAANNPPQLDLEAP